jgi:hypothetical protein
MLHLPRPKETQIKSESHGSIHPEGARTSSRHFPFVPSAALARCIEGANEKYSPRTD